MVVALFLCLVNKMKNQLSNFVIALTMATIVVFQIDWNKEPELIGEIPKPEVLALNTETAKSEKLQKYTYKVYDSRLQETIDMGNVVNALRANLYFEAGNQIAKFGHDVAREQMIWITWVTIKRSYMFHNKSIQDAVLKVKYKNGEIEKYSAHYSWMADGEKIKKIEKDAASQDAYWLADEVVHGVLSGLIPDPTSGHDHYCTLAVEKKTRWVKDMKKESRKIIGDHVFFSSPYPYTRPRPQGGI